MVDLVEPYLNRRDLSDSLVSALRGLREAQGQVGEPVSRVRSTHSRSQWRLGDRLTEADAERLIEAFSMGMSKRKLAVRYGISESSVKRLIRRRGASKPSR
jgi:DNA invertase Pin-like site-specific DNA recombinase